MKMEKSKEPLRRLDGFYPVSQVINAAGICEATLKRWEESKKISKPARDANKHRIYTKEQLDEIVRLAKANSNPE